MKNSQFHYFAALVWLIIVGVAPSPFQPIGSLAALIHVVSALVAAVRGRKE